MLYEFREFYRTHNITDKILENVILALTPYAFFFWAGVVFFVRLFNDPTCRFIYDIRAFNLLYLGVLLLSLDHKESWIFTNLIKNLVEKFKTVRDPLLNVRAEYINEVDRIFRSYLR
jgi:hypothetical protein